MDAPNYRKCCDQNQKMSSLRNMMKVVHHISIQTVFSLGRECKQYTADVGRENNNWGCRVLPCPLSREWWWLGSKDLILPSQPPSLSYAKWYGAKKVYHNHNLYVSHTKRVKQEIPALRLPEKSAILGWNKERVMQRKTDVIFDPPGWWAVS